MSLLTLPDTHGSGVSERAKALVFEDPRSRELLERVRALAGNESAVLLLGEVGTGRELVARHIHELSLRRLAPFLSIDCASFAGAELEAELFGQEKEAVPGAPAARTGVFENADGGTLFMDAIGDVPLVTQAKLVRVLEEHQFRRLGARRYTPFNVRLILASNVDLAEAVEARHFRADLLRIISGTQIIVPPLRERRGDILPLARHFLQLYQQRIGIGGRALSREAEALLLEHSFPNNIRELETAIHHALLRCRGRFVGPEELRLSSAAVTGERADSPMVELERSLAKLFELSPPNLHELIDEAVLRSAYRFSRQNQLKTARLLGISRNVVRSRLIQYGELAGFVRTPAPSGREVPENRSRRIARSRSLVRLGYQPFGLLKLLRVQGGLERQLGERGYQVEWAHYPSGIRLVEALRRGRLSLGVVGEGPPIFAQATGVPIVYIAAEAPAPEAEAIVVLEDSPIRTVAQLRGKRIAVLLGSNTHYLLIRALEEAGLAYGDVSPKFVFKDAARARFEHREVDAWVVGDPTLAELQQQVRVRVLRDAKGLASNPAYYLASADFAAAHPEIIALLRQELRSVQRWAAEHLDEAAGSLATQLGVGREAMEIALKRGLGEPLEACELIASQQSVADAFFGLSLIPRAVAVADAAWSLG